MVRSIVESRGLAAMIVAAITGTWGVYTYPYSHDNVFLGLIAAIAPMLGLLGTVVGMVGAFDTISASEGFARPDQLAGDISKALVTTLMGLTLAIPATAALTYFRNRIDALTGDVADIVEQLAAHLEHEPAPAGAPARRAAPAGAPS